MYTPNQLQKLTGRNIATIYRWLREKKIPSKYISGIYLIPNSKKVEDWIKAHK